MFLSVILKLNLYYFVLILVNIKLIIKNLKMNRVILLCGY